MTQKLRAVDPANPPLKQYPIDDYAKATLEETLARHPRNVVILAEFDGATIEWKPVVGGESAAFGLVSDCFALMQNVRDYEE